MLVFGVFFFPVPVFLESFILHSWNPFASCFDSWLYWLRERGMRNGSGHWIRQYRCWRWCSDGASSLNCFFIFFNLRGCKPNPSVCGSSFPGPKCTGMVRWPIPFLLFIYSFYSNFPKLFLFLFFLQNLLKLFISIVSDLTYKKLLWFFISQFKYIELIILSLGSDLIIKKKHITISKLQVKMTPIKIIKFGFGFNNKFFSMLEKILRAPKLFFSCY